MTLSPAQALRRIPTPPSTGPGASTSADGASTTTTPVAASRIPSRIPSPARSRLSTPGGQEKPKSILARNHLLPEEGTTADCQRPDTAPVDQQQHSTPVRKVSAPARSNSMVKGIPGPPSAEGAGSGSSGDTLSPSDHNGGGRKIGICKPPSPGAVRKGTSLVHTTPTRVSSGAPLQQHAAQLQQRATSTTPLEKVGPTPPAVRKGSSLVTPTRAASGVPQPQNAGQLQQRATSTTPPAVVAGRSNIVTAANTAAITAATTTAAPRASIVSNTRTSLSSTNETRSSMLRRSASVDKMRARDGNAVSTGELLQDKATAGGRPLSSLAGPSDKGRGMRHSLNPTDAGVSLLAAAARGVVQPAPAQAAKPTRAASADRPTRPGGSATVVKALASASQLQRIPEVKRAVTAMPQPPLSQPPAGGSRPQRASLNLGNARASGVQLPQRAAEDVLDASTPLLHPATMAAAPPPRPSIVPMLDLAPLHKQWEEEASSQPCYTEADDAASEPDAGGKGSAGKKSKPPPPPEKEHYYHYPRITQQEEAEAMKFVNKLPYGSKPTATKFYQQMVEARQNCEHMAFRGHRLLDQANTGWQMRLVETTQAKDEELEKQKEKYEEVLEKKDEELARLYQLLGMTQAGVVTPEPQDEASDAVVGFQQRLHSQVMDEQELMSFANLPRPDPTEEEMQAQERRPRMRNEDEAVGRSTMPYSIPEHEKSWGELDDEEDFDGEGEDGEEESSHVLPSSGGLPLRCGVPMLALTNLKHFAHASDAATRRVTDDTTAQP